MERIGTIPSHGPAGCGLRRLAGVALVALLLSVHAAAACEHPPLPPDARSTAAAGAFSLPTPPPGTDAVVYRLLEIDVRDPAGAPIDARASVRAWNNVYYPYVADTSLFAHQGYFYPRPGRPVLVPEGSVTITVSHGPEWIPAMVTMSLDRDTVVRVTLERLVDLRARGRYAGELHAHTRHPPVQFPVSAEWARRVAQAEDLAVLHLLDQAEGFAGAPHPASDDTTVVYCSYEHRNQTYGHVTLAGLREHVTDVCCLSPEAPWPMLVDLAERVAGPGRALFVLAHPHTTDAYDFDADWPGAGLGREYPVAAALGRLDGFDVVSLSNEPNARWQDWADAVSSGLVLTPTAGSDAVMNWFQHPPPGIWRVVADLGPGASLDYDDWVEAVRAGRTFVTSLPLVPAFEVGGRRPGEALEVPGETLDAEVRIEAACVTGLSRVEIVSDRGGVWAIDLGGRVPAPLAWDTTFTLHAATPAWVGLRVDGIAGHRVLLGLPAVAHTNAIRLTRDGGPRRVPEACGRMLDRIDRLESRVRARGGWLEAWHLDTVLARIASARAVYGRAFVAAPGPFALQTNLNAGPTEALSWFPAVDPEAGDRVAYRIALSGTPTFVGGWTTTTTATQVAGPPVPPGVPHWCRIEAVDRGGNVTPCSPALFRVTFAASVAGAAEAGGAGRSPRVWPNPARGAVRLEGFGHDAAIVDIAGRRVATAARGLAREGHDWLWDPRGGGGRVRPGIYWAVSGTCGVRCAVVVLD